MYCISLIFAELGEAYARQLQGGSFLREEFLGRASIASAIAKTSAHYCKDEEASLRAGVHLFFRDDDPEFVHVKWNLAQNFYISKALGIDPSGSLLSKEVLGDAVLYLDTNILISALTPIDTTHQRFLSVSRVCANLGIELKFCQISLDELRHTVATQTAFIRQMNGKIPRASSEKITNVFHMVHRHAQANNSPDPDAAFENFYNPIPVLSEYLAERVDDEWFVTEASKVDEDPILQKVRNACTRPTEGGQRRATRRTTSEMGLD